jgi:hypothetical protein
MANVLSGKDGCADRTNNIGNCQGLDKAGFAGNGALRDYSLQQRIRSATIFHFGLRDGNVLGDPRDPSEE